MANIHILANAASDHGIYSGGSWVSTLPLTNMIGQQPTQRARSVNTLATSTKFVVDLGYLQPVSMFALIAHNISSTATVRFRLSEVAAGTTPSIDYTTQAIQPNVPWGSMAWGSFPWEGFTEDTLPGGVITFYQSSTIGYGRYILVDITDTDNDDGYVEIGRFMAGEAFVPTHNFAYGAAFSFVDDSRPSRSVGGQLFFDLKQKRRRFSWSHDALTEGEAYGAIYDFQARLGITGSLLVVYDPEDPSELRLRRAIYGTLTDLGNIISSNSSSKPYAWSTTVEELV